MLSKSTVTEAKNFQPKSFVTRKKEFAKVYCLQYGWPEVFLFLREILQPEEDTPASSQIIDELSTKVVKPNERKTTEARNHIVDILSNVDLKKFEKFLLIVDWEKAQSLGKNAIHPINADLWHFLRTHPHILDIDTKDLKDYVEWSTVIRSERLYSELAETPIEALDLSVRVFKSLKRTGITTVGDLLDLLEKGEAALMSIRNFGEPSLNELREKMREKGFLQDDTSKQNDL